MSGNETAAPRYSGEAAHEKPPTTPSSITEGNPHGKFNPAAAESAEPIRPLSCRTLLTISRTAKSRLVVEIEECDGGLPVVKIRILLQTHFGRWYSRPQPAGIRVSELKRVAVALARAFKEYGEPS